MGKVYFCLLILLLSSVIYGQTLESDYKFRIPASVVYVKGNPELYLIDAKVRFYANFKVKYKPPIMNRYDGDFSMYVPTVGGEEIAKEEEVSEMYLYIPRHRIYDKPMEGWLDDKKRAEAFSRGFNKSVGRVLGWMLGGR